MFKTNQKTHVKYAVAQKKERTPRLHRETGQPSTRMDRQTIEVK
jgi:hypothetical protein